MIRCTIGVFAHNEAHNVRRALHALLAQQLQTVTITEIVVIASGCTDGTVELAREVASTNPVVTVDVETHRSGKASAIRRLMSMARGDVIVFVSADTLPAPDAIEHLLAPFADPKVGMTGARVVPLNTPTSFLGFAVQLLWFVHHHLALRKPKLGELVACRNVITEFPVDTATDDLALEALITRQGYELAYAPKAIVYNRGPENFDDFVLQRRRIFAGEVGIAFKYRYLASSLNIRHVLPLATDAIKTYHRCIPWIFGAMAIELWSRLLGMADALRGREGVIWRHARSTKKVVNAAEPVTLVAVRWSPSVDSSAMLLELQRLTEDVGSVFWWNGSEGEVFLKLDDEDLTLEQIQRRLGTLSTPAGASAVAQHGPLISYRLVQFGAPAPPASI